MKNSKSEHGLYVSLIFRDSSKFHKPVLDSMPITSSHFWFLVFGDIHEI
jgi:hypothetical protein